MADVLIRMQIVLLAFYKQAISPMLGPRCRFTPTCSVYAADALRKYGFVRGNLKAIGRILRCNPWGGMGEDPA